MVVASRNMVNMFSRLEVILVIASVLRVVLIWWAEYQDRSFSVPYTDIDYHVFTDAASHVVSGHSPFDRDTYRYTPILAWILTPNIFLARNFGKYLFSACDIVVGYLIFHVSLHTFGQKGTAMISTMLWLFNPITIVVSTRGSADSLVTLLVLLTLKYHHGKQWLISGLFYGLAVHFKIYPITYLLSLYFAINRSILPSSANIKFVFMFLLSLGLCTYLGYHCYGWTFIEEAYLYHITRKDVKHNFSPYFYLLYLMESETTLWLPLVTFVPQLAILLYISFKYRGLEDLNLAVFCETLAFVTFNKVVTSQYFLWYLSLLPLCWPVIGMSIHTIKQMAIAWLVSQGAWLLSAYLLEFQGFNTFLLIWICSLMFFIVNVVLLAQIMKHKVNVKKTV